MADEKDTTQSASPDDATSSAEASGASRRAGRRSRAREQAASTHDSTKQKFFTLIPANTHWDFVGTQKQGVGLSAVALLITFLVLLYNSVTTGSALNYGIDFQGGSTVRLALSKDVDIEALRTTLEQSGYEGGSVVTVPDAANEVMIRVKDVVSISEDELARCETALEQGLPAGVELLPKGFVHPAESSKIFMKFTAQPAYGDVETLLGEAGCTGTASAGNGKPEEFPLEYALVGVGNDIAQVIDREFGAGTVDSIVSSETVGAKVGSQLKLDGVKATLIAIGFIFLYVLLRFDLRYAPGGIIALIHDALIMVGAYAVTGREFNLQAIAAILTIVGYSINDTIVVFDRIRERVALFRDDPVEKTVNLSLNETLSRTILTSGTTLLVVLCVLFIGSGPIKDFAFALTVGLVAGTYSSIYVASPVFLWLNDKIYQGKGHLIGSDAPEAEGTGQLLGDEGQPPAPGPEGEVEVDAAPGITVPVPAADTDEPDDSPSGEPRRSRRRRRPG
jgi:preprotein translocase subunit SecF